MSIGDLRMHGGAFGILVIVVALFSPHVAFGQVKHGGEINQVCVGPVLVDPAGQGVARPGDPFHCTVLVRNADEFEHTLRLTSITVCTDHLSGGRTCTANLLPGNEPGKCAGGLDDGKACGAQSDCRNGACAVTLQAPGDSFAVQTSDVVDSPTDNNPLLTQAIVGGTDVGTGLEFSLTITTPLQVIQSQGAPPAPRAVSRAGNDRHGGEIKKGCSGPASVDPDGKGFAGEGDPITCRIEVTNKDDFGHAVRVNSIVDTLEHAGGATTTANLLPGAGVCSGNPGTSCTSNGQCGSGRCSIGSTCVGGRDAGSPCVSKDDCQDGACSISPSCLGGNDDGAPCTSQADCSSPGTCTVTLHLKEDVVVVTHTDEVRPGDPDPLPDKGTAQAVDLGDAAEAGSASTDRTDGVRVSEAQEATAGGLGLAFGALVKTVGARRSPTPTPTQTPNGGSSTCGDADDSGAVTVTDGVQTLRDAAGLPSPCTASRCDMDGNGSVTVSDGVKVLRYAAELPVTLACP